MLYGLKIYMNLSGKSQIQMSNRMKLIFYIR